MGFPQSARPPPRVMDVWCASVWPPTPTSFQRISSHEELIDERAFCGPERTPSTRVNSYRH